MMDNDSQQLESLFPELLQQDGIHRFLRGKESNLQPLRSYRKTKIHDEQSHIVPSMREDEKMENSEKTLHHAKSVSVTLQNVPGDFKGIIGQVIITTKRVFFIAQDEKDTEKDFSIDAQCISLHAMMSEPDISLYCQLADDNEYDEDYIGPVEIFFYSQLLSETERNTTDIEEEKKYFSNLLFESFTKLINLNPVLDDEDDAGAAGGLAAMLGMFGNSQFDENDEMICRIDPSEMKSEEDQSQQEVGAPSSERSSMLNRLDNMLVVPPEYEIDGQFDDADEGGEGDVEAVVQPKIVIEEDEEMNNII